MIYKLQKENGEQKGIIEKQEREIECHKK